MGRSYSLDLRVRVAGFVEAGHCRRAAARHLPTLRNREQGRSHQIPLHAPC